MLGSGAQRQALTGGKEPGTHCREEVPCDRRRLNRERFRKIKYFLKEMQEKEDTKPMSRILEKNIGGSFSQDPSEQNESRGPYTLRGIPSRWIRSY